MPYNIFPEVNTPGSSLYYLIILLARTYYLKTSHFYLHSCHRPASRWLSTRNGWQESRHPPYTATSLKFAKAKIKNAFAIFKIAKAFPSPEQTAGKLEEKSQKVEQEKETLLQLFPEKTICTESPKAYRGSFITHQRKLCNASRQA